jgi:ribosomal protein S18 acetylase RimI-like enzyme
VPATPTLRDPSLPGDAAFLVSVYASTRAEDLAPLGWSSEQFDSFVRTQYELQARHYDAAYPDAVTSVVEVDGARAGRLIVDRSQGEILVLDIALLPEFRDRGVGSQVMQPLIAEADERRIAVRCHVGAWNTGSRAWFERLGFVAGAADGAHLPMERACGISLR